jgi:class 3 adenylate cyclase
MSEERRHIAILFSDIAGYTSIMGTDESKAMDMLARNRTIHETHIKQFNGILIKDIGDAILGSFNLASDAVRCAIEIQKSCKEDGIPLKIGIHEGEVVFKNSDVLVME